MSKKITLKQVQKYRNNFDACKTSESTMNALTRSKLEDVTMDWEIFRKIVDRRSNQHSIGLIVIRKD